MDFLEMLTGFGSVFYQANNIYTELWVNWYTLIPATLIMYIFIFYIEYTLNGGNRFVLEGLIDELALFLPGGTKKRIELLEKVFSDWEEAYETKNARNFTGKWDSVDYAEARVSGDTKTLVKMTRIFGSWSYFWIWRPLIAFFMAFPLPAFIVTILLALLVGFLNKFITSKLSPDKRAS